MASVGFGRVQPFGGEAVLAGYLAAYEAARFEV